MFTTDVAANIRTIFVHNGEPVAVDHAAKLLGWDIDTMDAAIKWRAVNLDETSLAEPRIARRELLEHAFDQWSLADIKAALSAAEWGALVAQCGEGYGKLVVCDRDTLRAAAGRHAEQAAATAALLRPAAEASIRRRAERERKAAVIVPEQFKRRRRIDGVREFTVTAMQVRYHDFVPFLRIRGRWLARLGFKQGMRIYITSAPGQLTITTTDPAADRRAARATETNVFALPAPLAHSAGRGAAIAAGE